MGFAKADIALTEGGPHLSPTDVANDPSKAAQMLKSWPGVTAAAFHVAFGEDRTPAEIDQQLQAICRLARVLAVPVVSVPAASLETDFAAEVERMTRFVRISKIEGVTLAVETLMGTWTETPGKTVELCRMVPGLGVALDPSHYLAGPFHSQDFDELYPFVRHVRLRDSGHDPEKFQVRVGQGEIEYGKIVNQLSRCRYGYTLSVDIHDKPEPQFPMRQEVRKLKYLLESLL
jgi:sugar phosphate isomerase/epimerase